MAVAVGAAGLIAVLFLMSRFPLSGVWWIFPWVLSLVFIGLPHGALDHEVILRLWRPQPPPRWAFSASIASYLLLAGAVMVGWFVAPFTVFVCFILLTWAHWGVGDLWWSWQRDPAYFTSGLHRAIFAVWRGSLPMCIPLVVAPQIYRQVAESICQLFSNPPAELQWIDSLTFRSIVMGCVLLTGLFEAILANHRSDTCLLSLSEGCFLLIGFNFLPPIPAIGFYFVFWHGLRHVLRLMKTEQLSFSMFACRSAPATFAALAMLALLGFAILLHHPNPKFIGIYLVLIATLTFPHSAVVIRDGPTRKALLVK